MLKNIPKNLSPQLLKVLMEMGHGDEIVLADGNYPAASNANLLIRCDGVGIPELLRSILELMPLDTYVEYPIFLMDTVGNDPKPAIWEKYQKIIQDNGNRPSIQFLDRQTFYQQGQQAYAIVATGEMEIYANIILKKGIIQ